MPIRFKCPSCQKALSVKDEYAGKRAACPACKKPMQIPAPVKHEDAEALAMSAFADAPKPAAIVEKAVGQPVKMECPWCMEEVEFAADTRGKQVPCPQCTRIVKVPLLKEDKPKDWRQLGSDGLPTG